MKKLKIIMAWCLTLGLLAFTLGEAVAFCGFYVAKADTKLFNRASKVVLVRDGDRTVLTMANDYEGDLAEFAIVIPVPTSLERDQIHVANPALIDHLDSYTAPRLVEYFDPNPCMRMREQSLGVAAMSLQEDTENIAAKRRAKSLGVTIEAEYTVGEYDIVILSAEQSGGLETWLRENGYRIPSGAAEVLGSYIKQKMRFFVAKVNLKEQAKLGYRYLRPLQVAYESPKFMLPIRLGMVNADGTQELFVFALTRKGRIETTNYRTVKLPEGMDVPLYVKDEFPAFYRSMFDTQVRENDMKAVFLEYAWDMGWCDPCAAEPLSNDELKELGVFWLARDREPAMRVPGRFAPVSGSDVFVTRLHLRYDNAHFPEDLMFQETSDKTNFQGRYVLRHPWQGSDSCDAADDYRRTLHRRHEEEAATLARLTGWDRAEIRKKMNIRDDGSRGGEKWWRDIWN